MHTTESEEPQFRRRPAARLAGLALAAVIGGAAIAAPLGAAAEELPIVPAPAAESSEPAAEARETPAEAAAPTPDAEADGSAEGPAEQAGVPVEDADEASAPTPSDEASTAETLDAPPAPEAKAGLREAKSGVAGPAQFGPVNTAPVPVDDHWQMLEGTTLRIADPAMLINDADPDGDWFTLNDSTEPSVGTRSGWGTYPGFAYTPPAGFTGTVTWEYKIRDDHGADDLTSDWASITVDVLPAGSDVDAPPVAADDTYLYTPGASLYIGDVQGLLQNDALDGQPVTSLVFPYGKQVGNGDARMLGTGGAFFAELADSPATPYTLTYRVCTAVACSEAFLWLYPAADGVEPSGPDVIPEAPVAAPDVYGVVQDTPLTVGAAQGLLANDSDAELGEPGELLEAIVDDDGLKGSLTWSTDGSFTYTPPAGFTGIDAFEYFVNDQHAYTSKTVQVELQVGDGSINHAPVAHDDHFVVKAGQTNLLPAPLGLANDSDPDGDAISVGSFDSVGDGQLNWYSGDWGRYTPPVGFVGIDEFTYTVKDEHGKHGNEAKLVFEVVADDGTNTPPDPHEDQAVATAGETLVVAAPGVLANDFDADGDVLAVLQQPGAQHGIFEIDADGGYRYTPVPGFVGTDNVDVTITDGLEHRTARLWIEVVEPGQEPVIGAEDFYVAVAGQTLEVDAPGVLANDIAPASAAKELAGIGVEPQHGTVTWKADGSFAYTPDEGYLGPDEFSYTLHADDEWQYPVVRLQVVAETETPGEGTPAEPGTPTEPGTPAEPGAPTEPGDPADPGDQESEPARPEEATPAGVAATAEEPVGTGLAETGADPRGAAEASALALLLGLAALAAARVRRRGSTR
ncbi:Ig-like domain-containing protein [Agromyces sp. NPDC057679]|uniref:Ig-like domain-containing protein n=1 Tax=Agromyces sp. NPDC057679 TaxID=3346207 RepID=UPI00366FD842